MKTVLTAALLWVLASGQVLACDVCGCAVGGNYLGILPQFRRHFAGVRFQYRTFDSEHPNLFGEGIEFFFLHTLTDHDFLSKKELSEFH
ncbi:MAG: hypothetical protein KAX50_12000 [Saprospiraceae bacterium]|nr:hypothetical protein [Saprospiraceae bacterium]